MKKKLFLDFDGCIANTIASICSCYNEDFVYYKDYKYIDWSEIETWDFVELDCADREYINKYFNQPRFFERLRFMPYADDVIGLLTHQYDITVISMGYSPNLHGKKIWLMNNLPYVNYIGVNFKEYSDKSHIDMSDAIFIDDSANNLITSNAKIKICFGDNYSWNKDWNGTRLYNWNEVMDYLNGQ